MEYEFKSRLELAVENLEMVSDDENVLKKVVAGDESLDRSMLPRLNNLEVFPVIKIVLMK